MIFKASRLLGVFGGWTQVFMPDYVQLSDESLYYRRRRWFGLSDSEHEVPFKHIASAMIESSPFSSRLVVETTGIAGTLQLDKVWRGVAQEAARAIRRKVSQARAIS